MTRWILALVLVFAGCSGDFHDGVGPRVPIPNVEGIVTREDAPAPSLRVEVRGIETHVALASGRTGPSGAFGLEVSPLGRWEIKVSGKELGDFDSETRIFELSDSVRSVHLPPFDISARGAALAEPPQDAQVPIPTLSEPLQFQWTPPSTAILTARVQLYDSLGADAFISVQTTESQIIWNGIGNQSQYQGKPIPPGRYVWRVKFLYPDSTEARTMSHRLTLQ